MIKTQCSANLRFEQFLKRPCLSHNLLLHIMRVYQLLSNQSTMVYEPVQEMVSFSFENRSEFVDFLTQLPNLTGLELLILMNPIIPPNQDVH